MDRAITAAKKLSISKKKQPWLDLKHSDPCDYQLRKFRSDYLDIIKQRLLLQQKEAKNLYLSPNLLTEYS